ncbi:hypothetical protein T484DRAFT_1960611 [Baffinella frigidus]|nr:hypothetical protein T484DRAFT_1960611 [Cryptophyta sp. CCMP2293]
MLQRQSSRHGESGKTAAGGSTTGRSSAGGATAGGGVGGAGGGRWVLDLALRCGHSMTSRLPPEALQRSRGGAAASGKSGGGWTSEIAEEAAAGEVVAGTFSYPGGDQRGDQRRVAELWFTVGETIKAEKMEAKLRAKAAGAGVGAAALSLGPASLRPVPLPKQHTMTVERFVATFSSFTANANPDPKRSSRLGIPGPLSRSMSFSR